MINTSLTGFFISCTQLCITYIFIMDKESNSTTNKLLYSENHMSLTFNNLHYKPKDQKNNGYILKNINGQFKSGRMSAILGPSGAGKTTLLNILSGFKEKGVQGNVLVNGEERQINDFKRICSYIPQDFAMLEHLTVSETLQISADLKLGFKIQKLVKRNVIDNIVQLFNLGKCTRKLVNCLSSGEKKRLSIGVELVSNPPILLLDEPTSGLDSVSSLQILSYLRKLAQEGRIIICVIHQPSSRLLELFDDVFVLSEGECIYNGSLSQMVKCLGKAGFHCPNYYNRADYAIEVASKEHGENLAKLIDENNKKFSNLETIVISVSNENDRVVQDNYFNKNGRLKKPQSVKFPLSCLEQFAILTKRALIGMWRDLMCVQLRIICHILVASLLGIVFWNVGSDLSKILSNTSYIFFCVLFIFFANSMPTVLSCPLETAVLLREHLNNWYSVEAYYFAKFMSDLPLQFLCPTVFCTISYSMTGQSNDFGRFLMFWGIGLLTSILGQSIGLLAGSACNMKLAVFLVPASCIPMLIFSGFFIRTVELSSYLQPFTKVSYFRYSLEGFIQAVYGYNRTNINCINANCQFKSVENYLDWNGMESHRYGTDVFVLSIWILFIQFLLYLSLVIKVKNVQ